MIQKLKYYFFFGRFQFVWGIRSDLEFKKKDILQLVADVSIIIQSFAVSFYFFFFIVISSFVRMQFMEVPIEFFPKQCEGVLSQDEEDEEMDVDNDNDD